MTCSQQSTRERFLMTVTIPELTNCSSCYRLEIGDRVQTEVTVEMFPRGLHLETSFIKEMPQQGDTRAPLLFPTGTFINAATYSGASQGGARAGCSDLWLYSLLPLSFLSSQGPEIERREE